MNGTRVALITGGAKRLGAHLARALKEDGWTVVVNTRRSDGDATRLVDDLTRGGGRARWIQGDVADKGDVASMFASVAAEEGRLDLLINNVGVYEPKPLRDTTPQDWDAQLLPNLSGAFYCCHSALPMLERVAGSVINIGYAGLHRGGANPRATAYEASKAGLLVLTRSIAVEYADRGVRANMISPGQLENSVDLPEDVTRAVPLGRAGTLHDMAGALRYLLGAAYVTGQNIEVAGGYRL